MPTCYVCKIEKNVNEFSIKNKEKKTYSTKCKVCHKEYMKIHYLTNKNLYIARAKRDKPKEAERLRNLIKELKPACVLCGETWTAALDLHHTNPSIKESSIGKLKARSEMRREAKKCIVLCATDHRKFHSGHPETIEKVNAYVAQMVEAVVSKTAPVSVQI